SRLLRATLERDQQGAVHPARDRAAGGGARGAFGLCVLGVRRAGGVFPAAAVGGVSGGAAAGVRDAEAPGDGGACRGQWGIGSRQWGRVSDPVTRQKSTALRCARVV